MRLLDARNLHRMPSRPLVLAHRGANRLARENTVDAFVRARELGADGVELDVRRTADGVLVVHHDAAVEPVGLLVEQPFAEIRAALPVAADAGRSARRVRGVAGERRGEVLAVGAGRRPGERGGARGGRPRARARARRRVLVLRPRDRRRGAGVRARAADRVPRARVRSRDRGRGGSQPTATSGCTPIARRCSRRRMPRWPTPAATTCASTSGPSTTPTRCRCSPTAGVDAIITNVPDVAGSRAPRARATRS